MSWTECFPVLTEEMVEEYEAGATPAERAEHEDWFFVNKIINPRKGAHVVAFSLFWRQANQKDGELPALDRETLMKAEEKGLVKRFAPWEHYVEPLLTGAARLREARPDVVLRVYLAADLEFLLMDLAEAGFEVYLMRTSSIRHNPGAMWRFLALEEKRKLVTVSDSDRALLVEDDIQRTELMAKSGLGFWRVPVWGDLNDKGMMAYRPILGCQFGAAKGMPVKTLMQALIWHTQKGTISTKCRPPGCGEQTMYGSNWPDYGFDEWFLQTALYPRIARTGVLSFIPANARSRLLPLDIEYCTWSNRRSEIIYFGSNGGCCGGGTVPGTKFPGRTGGIIVKTAYKRDIIAYTYAKNCGLGEAAAKNIQIMRDLGLTVEHRIWKNELINESALNDPDQVFYHHWHPQPDDREKRVPKEVFGKARHIAFYAYETDSLPPEFRLVSEAMEEIWVPSTFCRGIFSSLGRPVHVVPHAVSAFRSTAGPLPGSKGDRPLTVLFLFDAWSRLARKNPEAVIRVFKEAFPEPGNSRLIIKAHHLSPREHYKLHQICGRKHWITIVDEFLPEQELNKLFLESDILLSLQRSEGFGLNLAKAQSYGIPVITTGYGGHLDFCKDTAFLVDYEFEDAKLSNDPWYTGGNWAAPNEDAAIRTLKEVASQIRGESSSLTGRRLKGQQIINSDFSEEALKACIEERLSSFFPKISDAINHNRISNHILSA